MLYQLQKVGLTLRIKIMAIAVMEFQVRGYKIRKFLSKNQPMEIIEF